MKPLPLVTGLAVLAVLAGCSTPPAPDKHVATLETTGSSSSSAAPVSSASPPASRPRERLDMTGDELDEMYQTYNQCLTDHGLPKGKPVTDGSGAVPAPGPPVSPEQEAAAEAACLGQKPLPPWEYDTANPESADFVHRVVQCLRDKGVRYVDEEPPTPGDDRRAISFGGPNNDSDSITKGLNFIGSCEKESANK